MVGTPPTFPPPPQNHPTITVRVDEIILPAGRMISASILKSFIERLENTHMLRATTRLSFELLSSRSIKIDQRDEANLLVLSRAKVWVECFPGGRGGGSRPEEGRRRFGGGPLVPPTGDGGMSSISNGRWPLLEAPLGSFPLRSSEASLLPTARSAVTVRIGISINKDGFTFRQWHQI